MPTRASDEAGPYQAIPQTGACWLPEGHPATHLHEYERAGTAKLLTLFRPFTGELRAKGVTSAPNAVLHPWLQEQLSVVLTQIEKQQSAAILPPEEERPLYARCEIWLGHPPGRPLPPLRILLVLDNLAGHPSPHQRHIPREGPVANHKQTYFSDLSLFSRSLAHSSQRLLAELRGLRFDSAALNCEHHVRAQD